MELLVILEWLFSIEAAGWIGSILLALCAFPQAIKAYRQKHARGLAPMMLWAWFLGEWFTIAYIYIDKFSWPLIINYGFNIILLFVIIYYFYFPKDKEGDE